MSQFRREGDESDEDFDFIRDREAYYKPKNASFWFCYSISHGVECLFYLRGAVYCTTNGATRREALERAIVKTVLGQLEGLKI